jgi:drug/metabolite transporter (DMT)-like permease
MKAAMFALGPIAAFLSSVTWAFSSGHYAAISREGSAEQVNLIRALFATVLWGGAFALFAGASSAATLTWSATAYLAASIACSYGFGDAIFFASASRIAMSSALAIATTYPFWATLYGILFRGEPFRFWAMVGMLLCIGGVAALLRQSRSRASSAGSARNAAVGVGLALLASLLWAGNAVFLKLGASGLGVYQANALRFFFGVLLVFPQWWWQQRRPVTAQRGPWPWKRMLVPLVVDAGFGSVFYVYGLANSDLAVGATLSSLSPLVALGLGILNKTEQFTLPRLAAVSATVFGVVLLVLG